MATQSDPPLRLSASIPDRAVDPALARRDAERLRRSLATLAAYDQLRHARGPARRLGLWPALLLAGLAALGWQALSPAPAFRAEATLSAEDADRWQRDAVAIALSLEAAPGVRARLRPGGVIGLRATGPTAEAAETARARALGALRTANSAPFRTLPLEPAHRPARHPLSHKLILALFAALLLARAPLPRPLLKKRL